MPSSAERPVSITKDIIMAAMSMAYAPISPKFGTDSQAKKPPNAPPPSLCADEYAYAPPIMPEGDAASFSIRSCKNILIAQNSKDPAKNFRTAK